MHAQYIAQIKLVSPSYLLSLVMTIEREFHFQVYDGISLSTCKVDTSQTFTYTAGTLVGGLVEMCKGSGDKKQLDLAHNITLSVIK